MYQDAARLREQFWIALGRYMKPVGSAEGLSVNWLNYKTGVRHVYFRIDAGQEGASVAIVLTHPEARDRLDCFRKFQALKPLFRDVAGEDWEWEADLQQDPPLCRICRVLKGYSIYNTGHWPELISFLKPGIIALDRFWSEVKPLFEG